MREICTPKLTLLCDLTFPVDISPLINLQIPSYIFRPAFQLIIYNRLRVDSQIYFSLTSQQRSQNNLTLEQINPWRHGVRVYCIVNCHGVYCIVTYHGVYCIVSCHGVYSIVSCINIKENAFGVISGFREKRSALFWVVARRVERSSQNAFCLRLVFVVLAPCICVAYALH